MKKLALFMLFAVLAFIPYYNSAIARGEDEEDIAAANVGESRVVFQAAGPTKESIQSSVDAFRNHLGSSNGNQLGPLPSGRRDINWDGANDLVAAPNLLPPDFFNTIAPRGVVFSTPGTGFQQSADGDNPTGTPPLFGNLNPSYPSIFKTFSSPRLFTPLGSTITVVNFFVPGSNTPARVRGFGAVFTDVDHPRGDDRSPGALRPSTRIDYYDRHGELLYTSAVPQSPGDGGLSFLGVAFADDRVAKVVIKSGNQVLGAEGDDDRRHDVVAMDDFIYAEPQAE